MQIKIFTIPVIGGEQLTREMNTFLHSGEWNEAICHRRVLPLLAFTQHAEAKRFRENVFLQILG